MQDRSPGGPRRLGGLVHDSQPHEDASRYWACRHASLSRTRKIYIDRMDDSHNSTVSTVPCHLLMCMATN